jgi:hypothetical protein
MTDSPITDSDRLDRIGRELKDIRGLLLSIISSIRDAESEIPEKMRRFMNYFHDVHDIKFLYDGHGQPAPPHLKDELERLDDRYRQLLKEMNLQGDAFEKVRRDMASDPDNKWNHTKLLGKPKTESTNATRPSDNVNDGVDESGADLDGG